MPQPYVHPEAPGIQQWGHSRQSRHIRARLHPELMKETREEEDAERANDVDLADHPQRSAAAVRRRRRGSAAGMNVIDRENEPEARRRSWTHCPASKFHRRRRHQEGRAARSAESASHLHVRLARALLRGRGAPVGIVRRRPCVMLTVRVCSIKLRRVDGHHQRWRDDGTGSGASPHCKPDDPGIPPRGAKSV